MLGPSILKDNNHNDQLFLYKLYCLNVNEDWKSSKGGYVVENSMILLII